MNKRRDNVIHINNKYSVNENKKRKRDAKINKITKYRSLIIFSICMISILYVFSKKQDQEEIYDEKVATNEELNAELAELKETEAELQQSIESLSDPEYLAKIAREEYFLTGEGETVFIVPEENAANSESDSDEATSSETPTSEEELEPVNPKAETETPEATQEEPTSESP